MRKLVRLRLLAGMALLLALAPVQAAWAHAQLLDTVPVASAVLEAAPETIELQFNEPVTPLAITLVRPGGDSLDLIDATTGGATVTVRLPQVDMGTHVLSWRVVSTDGHPIAGSLVFSIGQVTGASAVDMSSDGVVSGLLWGGKALMFVALFVGIGGALFGSVAELPPAARRLSSALSFAGLLLMPTTLGLQGLDALGLSLASGFDGHVWTTGLSTSYGLTAMVGTLAFALSLCALLLPANRVARSVGLLAAALAALSLALSGHASAAEPQWLTRPAVFLHIGGVLFWVGALLPLWMLLRDQRDSADRALAIFSRIIPIAVGPLVASGLALAVVQMGAPGQQWLSPYGFILGAKLVLLIGLFGLALVNRLWLTTPALAGDEVARHRLRRSIGLEAVIVVVVLGLVAGWRFTPPPRALADASAQALAVEPIMVHLMDAETMAMVSVSPGSAGPVTMDIALSDMEGEEISAESIVVMLSSPALGIEPFRSTAMQSQGGWVVEGLTIPIAGLWLLDLEIRMSRFQLTKLQTEIDIP